ncbi:hypothetical protein AHAS_Ahas20G0218500 [Arachis hypogaea]
MTRASNPGGWVASIRHCLCRRLYFHRRTSCTINTIVTTRHRRESEHEEGEESSRSVVAEGPIAASSITDELPHRCSQSPLPSSSSQFSPPGVTVGTTTALFHRSS